MDQNIATIPMVDLKKEIKLLRRPLMQALTEVLDSGEYVLGEKGRKLERMTANYLGLKYSLGVANGTDALKLSLKALNIGPGDEVVTTPFTFVATAEAIAQVGAKPVFIDIDKETYNLDSNKLESALTPNSKAIIVVHLFGQAANMQEITKIAKANHLFVIEDACQSFGTEYQGKRVGSIGDIGCFSFFPSKNLGGFGDGGLVTMNEKTLYDKIGTLRNHGSSEKYLHSMIGENSRLNEFQAAVLLVKLHYLEPYLKRRIDTASRYTKKLHEAIKTPAIPKDRQHTFHQYCIEHDRRNELIEELKRNQIDSAIYYPVPLHLQEAFHYLGYKNGDFPIAEDVSSRILGLPISSMLSIENQNHIIATVNEFTEKTLP